MKAERRKRIKKLKDWAHTGVKERFYRLRAGI